jgi:hypothetical protein
MPCLVYALATMFITWPIVTQLSTHGLGAGYGDQFENVRLIWWAQYALQHGLNPFYQSLLGYPEGFFSATLWSEPLTYWPAVPFAYIIGAVAAFNLYVLVELFLSGLAAFTLCWVVLGEDGLNVEQPAREGAALIGGLIFMAYPAVQGHVSGGHSGVLVLFALPLFALCLWRIVHGAGWRTALLGALMLWITALGNGVQMVFTLFPVSLFMLGYFLLMERARLLRGYVVRNLAILFGVGLLLLMPFYLPLFIQLTGKNKTADLSESGWVQYSADPLSFVSPSPFTPWGKLVAPGIHVRYWVQIQSKEAPIWGCWRWDYASLR